MGLPLAGGEMHEQHLLDLVRSLPPFSQLFLKHKSELEDKLRGMSLF